MKVALVHDFLNQYGGAERVLEAIHDLYPYAHVYTSLHDPTKLPLRMHNWDIRPFKLPKLPLVHFLKYYTAFYPFLFEGLDLSEYDLVISSTAFFAKGIKTRPDALHISYIHTPPRFLYHYPASVGKREIFIYRPILAVLDNFFRIWDYQAAQRPDYLIANSKQVAERIRKFYRRKATVIYPGVELPSPKDFGKDKFKDKYLLPADKREQVEVAEKLDRSSYYFLVSRLLSYKRIDLVIKAANKLNLSLKIAGTGPEEKKLKKIAGSSVEFLGFVSDERLSDIYSNCDAFIFPADEDFGIVPVEAMNFGKPVIAYAKGGSLETIVAGKTGEFFYEPTVESLVEVLEKFNPKKYQASACRSQAAKFSLPQFKNNFSSFVESKLPKGN